MFRPVFPFALATLLPIPLMTLGAIYGGVWVWLAMIYLTVFTVGLDKILQLANRNGAEGVEFPAADGLSAILAVAQFGLVPLGIAAVSGATGLPTPERIGSFFAFGLFFGQVSNSNAHELIHRSNRVLFGLGQWVYTSLLYGHHTTAHRLLHHRYVATRNDPNFPPKGINFYQFFPRAWIGSFTRGFTAEQERLAARTNPGQRINPYYIYVGGAVLFIAASLAVFGVAGLVSYLGLAFYAQTQLVMSDYLQHYGLPRQMLDDGRYAPMAPHNSWNTPHWFSSALMVNAPRHSDHHANPSRPYPALRLPAELPMLPLSLPVMGVVALFPPVWRRMMDHRVDKVLARAQASVTGPTGRVMPS
jgi:alkane 1-monooxygenase